MAAEASLHALWDTHQQTRPSAKPLRPLIKHVLGQKVLIGTRTRVLQDLLLHGALSVLMAVGKILLQVIFSTTKSLLTTEQHIITHLQFVIYLLQGQMSRRAMQISRQYRQAIIIHSRILTVPDCQCSKTQIYLRLKGLNHELSHAHLGL